LERSAPFATNRGGLSAAPENHDSEGLGIPCAKLHLCKSADLMFLACQLARTNMTVDKQKKVNDPNHLPNRVILLI
jgi:hypothetical protein